MKSSFSIFALIFILSPCNYSQDNYCLYFPIEQNFNWNYENINSHSIRTTNITDTITIHNLVYYKYSFSGSNNNSDGYWLRPTENNIFLLNLLDSTEIVLFDFSAVQNEGWAIPYSNLPQINNCTWGDSIVLVSNSDIIVNQHRTFYYCYHFKHFNFTCNNAGILDTWFARDFGLVQYQETTISGTENWDLIIDSPDTSIIVGRYDIIANPCLTIPCLPVVVSIISAGDTNYVLSKNDIWFPGSFYWEEYNPIPGDSILAKGVITRRNDINRNKYFTIEIIDFTRYFPTIVLDNFPEPLNTNPLLGQNYPNPFNPNTLISYALAGDGQVIIKIYDTIGIEVKTLVDEYKQSGFYKASFNASNLVSGVYFYKFVIGNYSAVKKMVLLR